MRGLLIVLFLLPGAVRCQQQLTGRQLREYVDTISFPVPFQLTYVDSCGLPKQKIFSRCVQYLATKLTVYAQQTMMQDSASGKIVVPGITTSFTPDMRYTLTIDVRDGKYRCRFENYFVANALGGKIPLDEQAQMKGAWLGAGTKHQHWQLVRYQSQQEAATVFRDIKAFVAKNDDF